MKAAADRSPSCLLVTAVYPPVVGGSAVLFQQIYTRCSPSRVVVLTDVGVAGGKAEGAVSTVRHSSLAAHDWGLLSTVGARHYLKVAAAIRTTAKSVGAKVVHCGRVLPEGLGACMARLSGGPRFGCWVHGEDLATARTSRELTLLTRAVLQASSVVFANSQNTSRLAQTFGIPPRRIEVVYPGVDCERFHPRVSGAAVRARHGLGDATVLLTVGRLQSRKGHDVTIRAVAELGGRFPTIRYVIVGDGDERDRLQQLTQALGVRDLVVFAGQVADAQLPEYFAACDLFVLANREEPGDIEGFGIVFLEAAASGKPAIGGNSGGVGEAISDGRTGLLVDADDVQAVAAAIERLAGSPSLRQRLGLAGRERAQNQFSWERAAGLVRARI